MKVKNFKGSHMYRVIRFVSLITLMLVLTGCSTPRITDTPRSHTEELLLSTATDNAVRWFNLASFAGKRVKVDFSNLKSVDQEYVKSIMLTRFGSFGILIIQDDKDKNIEYIIEVSCGGLATNSSNWLLGIPAITVPIPLAGPVQTPEVAAFKVISQDAVGKFGFRVYNAKTGEQVTSQTGIIGQARYHHYSFIGIPWTTSTIPNL